MTTAVGSAVEEGLTVEWGLIWGFRKVYALPLPTSKIERPTSNIRNQNVWGGSCLAHAAGPARPNNLSLSPLLFPFPGGAHDVPDIPLGFPAQKVCCAVVVGVDGDYITGAPFAHLVR